MLATITRAITAGLVVEARHLSLTSGHPQNAWPRWHWLTRGFAGIFVPLIRKNRFADFVLTRIERARPTQEPIPESQRLSNDVQWNRMVPLDLVPHPGVGYPAAIEADYAMTCGHLALRVRAPLAGYALKRWSVDCSTDHRLSPKSHHLWLRNAEVLHDVESAILAPGFTASPDTPAAKA